MRVCVMSVLNLATSAKCCFMSVASTISITMFLSFLCSDREAAFRKLQSSSGSCRILHHRHASPHT